VGVFVVRVASSFETNCPSRFFHPENGARIFKIHDNKIGQFLYFMNQQEDVDPSIFTNGKRKIVTLSEFRASHHHGFYYNATPEATPKRPMARPPTPKFPADLPRVCQHWWRKK